MEINHQVREETFRKSIEKYGSEAQIDMAIEEMSELTKALLKFRRFGWSENSSDYLENIYEEIADVKIMIRQLEMIYDCDFAVGQWIDKKVMRQIERLAGKRR
jgi:NTP pyrophosphatase (non-canonical NTP hydrolase)